MLVGLAAQGLELRTHAVRRLAFFRLFRRVAVSVHDYPQCCPPTGGRLRVRSLADGALAVGLQGSAQQLGRDVDDRNDPLVRHARRTDDPEYAHRSVFVLIWGRDNTIRIQELVSRFVADEDLDAVRLHALVQQVQDVALPTEGLEQALQIYVRDLVEAHEIRLAGDDELWRGLDLRKNLLRHLDGL